MHIRTPTFENSIARRIQANPIVMGTGLLLVVTAVLAFSAIIASSVLEPTTNMHNSLSAVSIDF
ncbi:hypothetical protein [Halobaculum rubrum]|uniref:hypothetical protein n=1 Tax=Halobaculum rubrum TaxID=2872158 RepID=UPI001CA437B1|nr:hypothetical protein [Halobaculum rubrum]QZY01213.1 hypothetical protein K6T25_15245 [Halobaculum rubrum]